MVGKMLLPKLGGTPAVWNTCMVFFQAALLAGYGYAHTAPAWLGLRRQTLIHIGLMLVPFLVLPIAVAENYAPPGDVYPILPMLSLLLLTVGLPFIVVSTSAPLLQKWYAHTGHATAKDPYFLYAASNLGSMVSLIGYPWLIEPYLRLGQQGWLWTIGYAVLLLATGVCAFLLWRSPGFAEAGTVSDKKSEQVIVSTPEDSSTAVTDKTPDDVSANGDSAAETASKADPSAAITTERPKDTSPTAFK